MLRILVVALVALVGAMLLFRGSGPMNPESMARLASQNSETGNALSATVLPETRPLPAVAFIDQHGAPFAFSDLAGNPVLVFFGFTHCPDICPLTLSVLARAMDQLRAVDADSVPDVVFVSVDPERDTPEQIASYLAAFDENFIGITAADAELQPLLSTLGVTVHREDHDGETYNVVHNGTVYVLNRAGEWAALFGGSSHDADSIATTMRSLQTQL